MPPTMPQHPSATDLEAFALGRLGESAADWIGQHLEECPACRSAAASVPADTFVGLLGGPAGETPSAPGTLPSQPPADVPAALRDHPRYRVIRMLGRGGMGVVYQAEHKVMERLVAVKVISRALVDRPDALERFHREVRAAAKLDHPNIVKAYDAEQAGDLQLLAMEFVEGKSLADVLHKKGPLPIANACHYVRQAAVGLQHAFEHGMVHRDLKPHNLMLTPKGVVKILDFGLAKLASESARPGGGLTQDNMVMGTPEYMAPEQAVSSKTADVRADIYALGCTLYCLLAGRPPFRGDPLAIIVAHSTDAPPTVESLRPDTPPELDALVARCLAKNPADRPQTPKELADTLVPFSRTASKSAPSPATAVPSPTIRPPSGLKNRRWIIPAAVVAGLALVGIGLSAGGVFKVKTKDGTIVLENLPRDADVLVDGEKTMLTTGDGKPATIRIAAGKKQRLQVTKAGFTTFGEEVEIDAGGSRTISVRLEPAPAGGGFGGLLPGGGTGVQPGGLGGLPGGPPSGGLLGGPPAVQPGGLGGLPGGPPSGGPLGGPPAVQPGGLGGLPGGPPSGGPPARDEFVPLFNGKDLTGWVADGGGEDAWRVEDGELVMRGVALGVDRASDQSYLLTERNYADFVLRFQFRRTDDTGITGIALRSVPGETAKASRPDTTNDYPYHLTVWIGKYKEAEATGWLWWSPHAGQVRPLAVDRLAEIRPAGEWNDMEVEMRGQSLRIAVNGREVQNVMLNKTRPESFPALGLRRYAGRVGLLKRNGEVRFRKIEIKDLVADVIDVRAPGVAGAWDHSVLAKQINMRRIELLPDGTIKGAKDGKTATWTLEGSTLTLTWGEKGTLGKGIWRDVCTVAPDGKSYTGRDLQNNLVVGKRVLPLETAPDGFVSLFNGKDLTGWKTHPSQPGKWRVEQGALVGSGPDDSYVYTARGDYKNYHLRVEARINEGGDGGVFLRSPFGPVWPVRDPSYPSGYEAQINSTYKDAKTGSLFVQNGPGSPPGISIKEMLIPAGQWFVMEMIAEDNHLVIKVDGKTTADYSDEKRTFVGGHIALQKNEHVGGQKNATQTIVEFRKIEIKELPPPKTEGKDFAPLFNGKDLTGWKPHLSQWGNWHVENGVLIGSGPATSHLYSDRGDYKDFHLLVEARINAGGNSGVFFRAPFGPRRPQSKPEWPNGYEAQINSTHRDPKKTGSLLIPGSVSVIVGESPVPPGEWFTQEVIGEGNHIVIKVNGKTTADHLDSQFSSGHIALQQLGSETVAEFRKIEIKELGSAAAVLAPEKSEWSGIGVFKDQKGERALAAEWTITERHGHAFKALARNGWGGKAEWEGVIDANGRITLETRENQAPEAKPREAVKGTGEVGSERMTVSVENPDAGASLRVEFKRLPDGGESFKFQGRWKCFHLPNGWKDFRTIKGDSVFSGRGTWDGPWERDGGLIITHYPGGGREWLIIDPDKPNELHGSNGSQSVTWIRQ